MKDILEILEKFGQAPSSQVIYFVVAGIVYSVFICWKHFWSKDSTLERRKRGLEILKLELEIHHLHQTSRGSAEGMPKELDSRIRDILDNSNSKKKSTSKPSFWRPSSWWKSFFVGCITASIYPLAVICNSILNLPPGTTAETLKVLCLIWFGFVTFTVVIGGLISARLSGGEKIEAALLGATAGIALYHLAILIFKLANAITLVFLNAK